MIALSYIECTCFGSMVAHLSTIPALCCLDFSVQTHQVTLAVLEVVVTSYPTSALFGGLMYVKAATQLCMQHMLSGVRTHQSQYVNTHAEILTY